MVTKDNILEYIKSHPLLSFPFVCKGDMTYLESLSEIYEEYQAFARKYLPEEDISIITKECEQIKDIIKQYLKGKNTYWDFEEVFLSFPRTLGIDILSQNIVTFEDDCLYRARVSPTALSDREEIFHIPFDKRHLVEKFRYAVDGVPSLYLASSPYLCWLELDKPKINDLWLSAIRVSGLKVLDLAYDLSMLCHNGWSSDEKALGMRGKLHLYPLVIASNFQVKYVGAAFHEEYIIPSLLTHFFLDWNTGGDGIRFFSTKLSNPSNLSHVNYMLFTKPDDNDRQYSSFLKEHVTMTKPQSWTELQALNVAGEKAPIEDMPRYPDMEKMIIDHYEQTSFYKAEQLLKNLQYETIS